MLTTRMSFFQWLFAGVSTIAVFFMSSNAYAQQYDLTRGEGAKTHSCLGLRLGPEISLTDIDLAYVKHNSIKLRIKGTTDSVLCVGFFSPARRNIALKTSFRFADGTVLTFEDIDKRTNLRALASPMLPGDPPGNMPAQGPRLGNTYAPGPAAAAPPASGPGGAAGTSTQSTGRQPKKCMINGKVTYTDGECLDGAEKKANPPRIESARLPPLPVLQSGMWKLSVNNNGTTTMTDFCGDPLDFFRKDFSDAGAEKARELGCRIQGAPPAPHQVLYLAVCPTDWVSVHGDRFVKEGRSELRVTAPSPQSYTTDWTDTIVLNRRQVVQGVRTGNCD